MAWVTLTENDVERALSGAELAAFKTAALATGQEDPLPGILASVVREVRGRVAACQRNKLGPDGTIPDECEAHALSMIAFRLINRLPGMSKFLEARQKASDDAAQFLRDVALCHVAITQPEEESAEETGSLSPSISGRTRTFTRDLQDGI